MDEETPRSTLGTLIKELAYGLSLFLFLTLGVGYLLFMVEDELDKKKAIESAVTDSYFAELENTCNGYKPNECRIVEVLTQEVELEPLRVTITAREDFNNTHFKTVSLDKLEQVPSEDLSYKYVKLLLKDGYTYDVEVVGSPSELERLVEKAINSSD